VAETLVLDVLTAMAMVLRFRIGCDHAGRTAWGICALLLGGGALWAQVPMPTSGPGGMVRLFGTDAAILESQEARKDLPCTVVPAKALLGFDLKFHAGYDVSIPLRELAGAGNNLTMVFRVVPEDRADEPVYFSQHVSVPAIEEDAHGDAVLQGIVDVGEGKYHVDWMMRDRAERVCSSSWDTEASLPVRDKQMALDIAPDVVQQADSEPFKQEPPVEREQHEGPLNVKVVVNFRPRTRNRPPCSRWTPTLCSRSCGTSRASRGSASFRLSRSICRSSA